MAIVVPQTDDGDVCHELRTEFGVKLPDWKQNAGRVFRGALIVAGMLWLGGCAGGAPELLSKDAEWFSERSSIFGTKRSLSMEAQAVRSNRPVSPEDLVSADGTCLGMSVPAAPDPAKPENSNAQAKPGDVPGDAQPGLSGIAPAPQAGGIALDMTECEVARQEGIASNTVIGAAPGGEREVTLTYLTGARPGIYRFTGGRLTSIERAPEAPKPAKPVRKVKKKPAKNG